MTLYTMSVSLHVIFAVATLGVSFCLPLIARRADRDPRQLAFALATIESIQRRIFFPGSLLVMLTGFFQLEYGGFGWGDVWLWLGIVIFYAAMAVAAFVMFPAVRRGRVEAERIAAAAGQPSVTPELEASLRTMRRSSPLIGAGIVFVIFLMEAKPF